MLKQSELLKPNQRWHFNITPIRLKCPICLEAATHPKQAKVCKNVKSLVYHLAHEHKDQYGYLECKSLLKAISRALDLGMIVQ